MWTRQTRLLGLYRCERGSTLIESAFAIPVLLLLSVGVFAVGINLDRYLQLHHLSRHAANMYGSDVDFGSGVKRALLLRNAVQTGITSSGGPGVIYLSKVERATGGGNTGLAVVTHRIVLGTTSISPSRTGSPLSVTADGHVVDYENSAAAIATLPAGVAPSATRPVYVAEVYHEPAGLRFPGLLQVARMSAISYF